MDDEEIPLALTLDEAPEPKSSVDEAQQESTTVPVTIVTGFLGSGKTTLVRHILTADHGYRIAVILNEFGEDVGIEASFVQSQEGLQRQHDGEWVELTNGCMCCAVKSDFLQALESLLDRPGGRRFDYILIETTGLANPGPIATALWTDAELESRVSLDGVVTVVDSLNIDRQLHEPRPRGAVNEAQVQVAYADIVVLNKLDLVEEEALVRAEADIRAINSGVTIVRTCRSSVDLGLILNRNGYSHKGELVLPPIAEADDEGDVPPGAPGRSTPERTSHAGEATGGRRRSAGISCCSSRAHSFHARSGAASAIAAAAAAAVAACNAAATAVAVAAGSSGPCSSADMSPAGSLVPPSPLLAAAAAGGGAGGAAAAAPIRASLQAAQAALQGGAVDGGDHHVHDNNVSTVSLRCDHPVDLERFKSWVDHLLWDRDSRADEVYRMKGLLWVQGSEQKHMLQAVYELYEVVSGPEWRPEEARATRVVIIGRGLRPAAVKASWAEFVGAVGPKQETPAA